MGSEYNRLAAIYDRWWRGYLRRTLTLLLHCAQLPPDARVLDVACGTGEWERLLLADQPQQQIVGVDVSAGMLRVAHKKVGRAPHASFAVANATPLPFPDQCFDVVVTASALHYFQEPHAALAEMHRVVVPHGQVIILDWCRDFATMQGMDWVLHHTDAAHQHTYTKAELHHMLRQMHFDIHATTRERISPVWGIMVVKATRH